PPPTSPFPYTTLFRSLAAHQLVKAAVHAFDAQRQDSIVSAAQAYFDLVATHSVAGVAREALCVSSDCQTQIDKAVSIGLAFKGEDRKSTRLNSSHLGI